MAIGRAVHWDAQILIMDEPTATLGVPEQRKVISLIHQLKGQGRGIIFISHNLQDTFAVSARSSSCTAGSGQVSAASPKPTTTRW